VDLAIVRSRDDNFWPLFLCWSTGSGSVPSLLVALGDLLPLSVTGRAVEGGP
jgi:hypothetical protein